MILPASLGCCEGWVNTRECLGCHQDSEDTGCQCHSPGHPDSFLSRVSGRECTDFPAESFVLGVLVPGPSSTPWAQSYVCAESVSSLASNPFQNAVMTWPFAGGQPEPWGGLKIN